LFARRPADQAAERQLPGGPTALATAMVIFVVLYDFQ
jgi:hypothetical protein